MVTVKSESEIAVMKKAGAILADVLALVEEHAKPGVTTKYLDKLAYETQFLPLKITTAFPRRCVCR